TDHQMAKRTGAEVLEAAEMLSAGIPRVLLTAYAESSEVQEAARRCGGVLLAKPVTAARLASAIATAYQMSERAENSA
ncbi:MAG: response regulator, partial [Zetaproteobacteria bacterium]